MVHDACPNNAQADSNVSSMTHPHRPMQHLQNNHTSAGQVYYNGF